MTTIILARTERKKEYMYSRNNAIEIPAGWTGARLDAFITGLNKYFKLPEEETYYRYEIDQYDLTTPVYKAYKYRGQYRIKSI